MLFWCVVSPCATMWHLPGCFAKAWRVDFKVHECSWGFQLFPSPEYMSTTLMITSRSLNSNQASENWSVFWEPIPRQWGHGLTWYSSIFHVHPCPLNHSCLKGFEACRVGSWLSILAGLWMFLPSPSFFDARLEVSDDLQLVSEGSFALIADATEGR